MILRRVSARERAVLSLASAGRGGGLRYVVREHARGTLSGRMVAAGAKYQGFHS